MYHFHVYTVISINDLSVYLCVRVGFCMINQNVTSCFIGEQGEMHFGLSIWLLINSNLVVDDLVCPIHQLESLAILQLLPVYVFAK
jgi:hypothetical protein